MKVSGDTTLHESDVVVTLWKFKRIEKGGTGAAVHEGFDSSTSYEGLKYKFGGEVTVEVPRRDILYGLAYRKTGAPMTTLGVPGDVSYKKDVIFSKSQKRRRHGPLHPRHDFFRPRPSLFDYYRESETTAVELEKSPLPTRSTERPSRPTKEPASTRLTKEPASTRPTKEPASTRPTKEPASR